MPELPEVETLTRALRSVVEGGQIEAARFFRADLREPIPVEDFNQVVVGQPINAVFRRSKYVLLQTPRGYAVIHLGMSGNVLALPTPDPKYKHTHAVFTARDRQGGVCYLHYVDARRFGRIDAIHGSSYSENALFSDLGPEPLDTDELGIHLWQRSRGKEQPLKTFLMDAHVVVGVGNIYANEALFRAGLRPQRRASTLSRAQAERLAGAIQETLEAAIAAGGTSFRDYKHADGSPGYFKVSLAVYDREGEPCRHCDRLIEACRIGGRATYFCPACQK